MAHHRFSVIFTPTAGDTVLVEDNDNHLAFAGMVVGVTEDGLYLVEDMDGDVFHCEAKELLMDEEE